MPHVVSEYVDRLATVEMRGGSGNLARGVVHRLYEAARERVGRPLSLQMAEALACAMRPGATLLIVTGAGGPPFLPLNEVDGVPGAAALSRYFVLSLGCRVVILAEARSEAPVRAAVRAAGLNIRLSDDPETSDAVIFLASPTSHQECQECRGVAVRDL